MSKESNKPNIAIFGTILLPTFSFWPNNKIGLIIIVSYIKPSLKTARQSHFSMELLLAKNTHPTFSRRPKQIKILVAKADKRQGKKIQI